jgi:hypothetical protein
VRAIAFWLATCAILALTALATDLLLGAGRRCEYHTADLGVDTSVPGGRVLEGGSHASIETEWGLFGYRIVSERRDGYFAPWSRASAWRMLPLCETIVLTAALWAGAACLLLRCARGWANRSNSTPPPTTPS